MIVQEIIIGRNGQRLVKTHSSLNVKIHGGNPEGDYTVAVDPENSGRTYTETDIPIRRRTRK